MTLLDRSFNLTRGVAHGLKQGLRHGIEQVAGSVSSRGADGDGDVRRATDESASHDDPRREAPEQNQTIEVPPLPEPRFGIDGWTFEGTELAGRFPLDVDAEASTLLHNVRRGLATPWTYDRLSELLAKHGAAEHALAVLEMYLAGTRRRGVEPDRGLERRHTQLANRLANAARTTRSGERVVVRLHVNHSTDEAGSESDENTATSA